MLRAYFDDSGKSDDPSETATVVAGAIAKLEDWATLEVAWRRILNDFSVREMHMRTLLIARKISGLDRRQAALSYRAINGRD